jgi:hypothetical protein
MTSSNFFILDNIYVFLLGALFTVSLFLVVSFIVFVVYKIIHIRRQAIIAENFIKDFRNKGGVA